MLAEISEFSPFDILEDITEVLTRVVQKGVLLESYKQLAMSDLFVLLFDDLYRLFPSPDSPFASSAAAPGTLPLGVLHLLHNHTHLHTLARFTHASTLTLSMYTLSHSLTYTLSRMLNATPQVRLLITAVTHSCMRSEDRG